MLSTADECDCIQPPKRITAVAKKIANAALAILAAIFVVPCEGMTNSPSNAINPSAIYQGAVDTSVEDTASTPLTAGGPAWNRSFGPA